MSKSESCPASPSFTAGQVEMPETFLKELSMDRIDGVDPAESPATSGWATPTLFGNAEEATQYYAVHGPPCQLWDGLALQAVLQQHEQKAVQRGGEDTPTYLGTFEQSQRLWEASGCPVAEPLLPPPEIERVVNFVANQRNQREALRAQHEQLLLALEPVVADQTAEEPAEEAADVVEEVYEQALEHVDYQKNPEAVAPKTENLEAPKAETASVAVVESSPSPDSELLSCGLALDNLNTNAPKFRPGMEECPYVAIGQPCRTSTFCAFGRCKSYLEGKCTRKRCKFCHCVPPQGQ